MNKYKIGDFAVNLGVSPDLLKHYEKYNIISSEKRGMADIASMISIRVHRY
ncbi:hypothetical protein SAMN04488542_104132 [Fontibacillus panacisegetis]|uniref:MerR family regulatory protein n=1 Tax=Fontibacillus panacisegetis TaxID=670482 RepID=A0A1G7HET5_9BACL|nr:hypothetical protein SAMN04488542_104132 [Fontibacillus panacisegetis]